MLHLPASRPSSGSRQRRAPGDAGGREGPARWSWSFQHPSRTGSGGARSCRSHVTRFTYCVAQDVHRCHPSADSGPRRLSYQFFHFTRCSYPKITSLAAGDFKCIHLIEGKKKRKGNGILQSAKKMCVISLQDGMLRKKENSTIHNKCMYSAKYVGQQGETCQSGPRIVYMHYNKYAFQQRCRDMQTDGSGEHQAT